MPLTWLLVAALWCVMLTLTLGFLAGARPG
jgi:hypothetical protein